MLYNLFYKSPVMIRLIIATTILSVTIQAKAIDPGKNLLPKKIIIITVDEKGSILIGKDTIASEQLADELQKRLWKSYMGTDKMYDSIRLEYKGSIAASIKSGIKKSIKEAQQKALTDICLQKHKKLFEDLNSSQQGKIRKQFPVLFQPDY